MNRARFEQLIRVLEATPEENFDIGLWRCGTKACAIGRACMDPWFQSQGWHLELDWPFWKKLDGMTAIIEFFEIDAPTADRLFTRLIFQQSATPQMVIEAIQDCFDIEAALSLPVLKAEEGLCAVG